ncbi:peroxiredoxin family protein [Kaarinaea lacus]
MTSKRYSMWLFAILLLVAAPVYSMAILKDFQGMLHTLDEYTGQGKWAIVMIWASDCSACNAEAKNYVKFNKAHKDKDAYIVGISMDGDEKQLDAEAFIDRHGVDFQNLIGEPEIVASIYQNLTGRPWVGTPTFLLFNPAGELRAAQVGAVPTHIIESFISKENAAVEGQEKI